MNYEDLHSSLMEFFGDTSRTPGQTKSGLIGIIDEAKMLIESISDAPEEEDDANFD
jgi:hypothetical protein